MKEKLLGKGNGSLAAGALFSISSLACPCPVCIGSAIVFLYSGLREKSGGFPLWRRKNTASRMPAAAGKKPARPAAFAWALLGTALFAAAWALMSIGRRYASQLA